MKRHLQRLGLEPYPASKAKSSFSVRPSRALRARFAWCPATAPIYPWQPICVDIWTPKLLTKGQRRKETTDGRGNLAAHLAFLVSQALDEGALGFDTAASSSSSFASQDTAVFTEDTAGDQTAPKGTQPLRCPPENSN